LQGSLLLKLQEGLALVRQVKWRKKLAWGLAHRSRQVLPVVLLGLLRRGQFSVLNKGQRLPRHQRQSNRSLNLTLKRQKKPVFD
jgi:hypothetical protein